MARTDSISTCKSMDSTSTSAATNTTCAMVVVTRSNKHATSSSTRVLCPNATDAEVASNMWLVRASPRLCSELLELLDARLIRGTRKWLVRVRPINISNHFNH